MKGILWTIWAWVVNWSYNVWFHADFGPVVSHGVVGSTLGIGSFSINNQGDTCLIYLKQDRKAVCIRVKAIENHMILLTVNLRRLYRMLSEPEWENVGTMFCAELIANHPKQTSELLRMRAPNGFTVLITRDGKIWDADFKEQLAHVSTYDDAFVSLRHVIGWLSYAFNTLAWFFAQAYRVKITLTREEDRHCIGKLESTLAEFEFSAHRLYSGDWLVHAIDGENHAVCFHLQSFVPMPELVTYNLQEIGFSLTYGSETRRVGAFTVELLPNATALESEVMRIQGPRCSVLLLQRDGSTWSMKMTERRRGKLEVPAEAFKDVEKAAAWIGANPTRVEHLFAKDALPWRALSKLEARKACASG